MIKHDSFTYTYTNLSMKVEGSSIEEAVASAIAMGATKDQVNLD